MSSVRVDLGPRSYEVRVVSGEGPGAFGAFARVALEATWAGRSCRSALIVTDEHLADLACSTDRGAWSGRDRHRAWRSCRRARRPSRSTRPRALYDQLVALKADRHTLRRRPRRRRDRRPRRLRRRDLRPGPPPAHGPDDASWPRSTARSAARSASTTRGPRTSSARSTSRSASGSTPRRLGTLPARELRCGLAEVVKYGVILDAAFFAELEDDAEAILARDPASLRRIVARSCELKAESSRRTSARRPACGPS